MWSLAMIAAFLLSWLLVVPTRALSWRMGTVDVPRDGRRMHSVAMPRNGGMAIYAGFFAAVLLFCRQDALTVAALKGGLLMLSVGLADDRFPLSAWLKLGMQCYAAVLTVYSGLALRGVMATVGVLWILTLTNAHNMIDGLNGLLAGTAAVECISLAALLALMRENGSLPLFLLAAGCIGFLPFNFPRASVFAGDCGSGSIGFILAVFSLPQLLQARGAMELLPVLFIFAYPLTDLAASVLRRLQHGKSLFAPDRAHLHHRICAAGLPQSMGTVLLWSLCASLGAVGVLCGGGELQLLAIGMILVTLALLIFVRRFLLHFTQNG